MQRISGCSGTSSVRGDYFGLLSVFCIHLLDLVVDALVSRSLAQHRLLYSRVTEHQWTVLVCRLLGFLAG